MDLPYHRKYRSNRFSEYVGNEDMKDSLMSMLRRDKKYQVILMEGPAGCGKTTIGRLLGKEYRCEERASENGACGVCESCKQFDEYILTGDTGFLRDVYEIDATDSNKKDDITRILDEVTQPTFYGDWTIVLFDESHMITQSAQNRLLKIFEEPPENVLFILCTTDPDKMLPTVTSRCQARYRVEKPSRDIFVPYLATICRKEGVEYDARGLSAVCVAGDFVPRQVLTALEQVVTVKGSVTYENTTAVLSVIANEHYVNFYKYLMEETISTFKYIGFLSAIQKTASLKDFVDGLLAFTKRGVYVANNASVEALDKEEIKQYTSIFSKFDPGAISFLLHTLSKLNYKKDVESELLLLGYTGIRGSLLGEDSRTRAENAIEKIAPMTADYSAQSESVEGDTNWQRGLHMTEEEKTEFIESQKGSGDVSELAAFFSGEIVNLPK